MIGPDRFSMPSAEAVATLHQITYQPPGARGCGAGKRQAGIVGVEKRNTFPVSGKVLLQKCENGGYAAVNARGRDRYGEW
jgi:hypothetical protein